MAEKVRILKLGDYGSDVADLERHLHATKKPDGSVYYEGVHINGNFTAAGEYTPELASAVKARQQDLNINADGKYGPQTRAAEAVAKAAGTQSAGAGENITVTGEREQTQPVTRTAALPRPNFPTRVLDTLGTPNLPLLGYMRPIVRLAMAAQEYRENHPDTDATVRPPLDHALMTSPFGKARSYEIHPGADFAAPVGTPIYAEAAGFVTVQKSGYTSQGANVSLCPVVPIPDVPADKQVCFDHFHMDARAMQVADGAFVQAGQKLGEVGMTGRTTGPHLHWQQRIVDTKTGKVEKTDPVKSFAEFMHTNARGAVVMASASPGNESPSVQFARNDSTVREANQASLAGLVAQQTVARINAVGPTATLTPIAYTPTSTNLPNAAERGALPALSYDFNLGVTRR